jgi:uncharacterized protein (DUF924 family)
VTNINDILDFWFAPESRPDHAHPGGRDIQRWFAPDPSFDDAIRKHFADTLERAVRGELDGWAETAEGALALTVLLDQFPRNMFRGQARAFAADGKALAVARQALARGFDQVVPAMWRKFFYLPFEHAEDGEAQARCVALFRGSDDPRGLRYAEMHKEIIDRFGRFPHRNAILGRASTPEEQAWLAAGGETFGTKA